jgi:hypothetical protein
MNYPGARQSTAGSLGSGNRFRNYCATLAVAAISEGSDAAAKRFDRLGGLLGRDALAPDFHSRSRPALLESPGVSKPARIGSAGMLRSTPPVWTSAPKAFQKFRLLKL